ncbi:hypothetical protein MESS4_660100 [Mesorhizobium sp. STM 4661]|nr:hypothetical protein MESS4_660100 [Mesorhizobium sp. STM 4661]
MSAVERHRQCMNADKSGNATGVVDVDMRPEVAAATGRVQIEPFHILDEGGRGFGPVLAQHALKHARDGLKVATFQGTNDTQAQLPAPETRPPHFRTMATQGSPLAIASDVRRSQEKRCNINELHSLLRPTSEL